MKNLRRKTIGAVIFLILACLSVALSASVSYFSTVFNDKSEEAVSQATTFARTVDGMLSTSVASFIGRGDDIIADATLIASAIAQEDPESLEPGTHGSGYIVKIENGNLLTPEGFPQTERLYASLLARDYDILLTNELTLVYAHIRGAFYYVEFLKDLPDPADTTDMRTALSNLADASGCDYVYMQTDKLVSDNDIYVATNDYYGSKTLADIGLTEKNVKHLNKNGSTLAYLNGSPKWIRLIRPDNIDMSADILVIFDLRDILQASVQQTIVLLLLSMIILVTLTVWILSVYSTVHDKILDEEQCSRYNPKTLKHKTVAALVASSLIIFIAAAFIISLNCLFTESNNEARVLTEFRNRLIDDEDRTEASWDQNKSRFIDTAKDLAALIDDHRSLQNAAWLRQASEIIGADYITIYDTNGDEVISSSRYRGLSLGKDEKSATYDFRRLLRGVKNISHASVTDEVTGLTRDLHGISLRYLSNDTSYGALIIAVDPERYSATVYADIEDAAAAMAPAEGFIIGVDPETGIVRYSSDEKMHDARMSELCSEIKTYTGSFMGFVNFSGTGYYVRSIEHKGIVYYCGVTQSEMFEGVLKRSFYAAFRFLIIGILLALILLSGYNDEVFKTYAVKKVDSVGLKIRSKAQKAVENASEKAEDLSRERTAFLKHSYLSFTGDTLSPGERAKAVLQFLVLISTVIISLIYLMDSSEFGGSSSNSDVFNYIAHGDWARGFNLFSVAAIFFLVCIMTVGLFLLKLITGLLYLPLDSKAQTTVMLVSNIIRYITIIIVVLFSLGYLGVDTRALVASAGLAGVAISLGSRDLIADIISGINILAEGTYKIGDIVQIGGFRGEVAEIGMRSTKIIGRGDNIKTIRNSSVGDVINYSRLNSWYPMLVTVRNTVDLNELEAMLAEELPKIAKSYPDMISGPEYRGVDSVNGDKTTILILTECSEKNINQVQRDINREITDLFKKHNIELL